MSIIIAGCWLPFYRTHIFNLQSGCGSVALIRLILNSILFKYDGSLLDDEMLTMRTAETFYNISQQQNVTIQR